VSDSRITLTLWSVLQAHQEIQRAWAWAKAMLADGRRLVLELRLETRSDAQNRLLHSRLQDVAKHCEWAGARRDVDTWRRLFTSAWLRTHGQQVELLPALDGHGVDIVYASTTKLSRAQCADLSEYVMAWGSERDVKWCLASLGRDSVDPETGEILEAEHA